MRLGRRAWLVMTGVVGFLVGVVFLTEGMHRIVYLSQMSSWEKGGLLGFFGLFSGGREQAALAVILCGLFGGFVLGRILLTKQAQQIVSRLSSREGLFSFTEVYGRKEGLCWGGLFGLGLLAWGSLFLLEWGGMVDVILGAAFMNSTPFYFRVAFAGTKR